MDKTAQGLFLQTYPEISLEALKHGVSQEVLRNFQPNSLGSVSLKNSFELYSFGAVPKSLVPGLDVDPRGELDKFGC